MTIHHIDGRMRKLSRSKPSLLLVLASALLAPSSMAQTVQSAAGASPAVVANDPAQRSLYTVEIGPAPQPGGETVLTLLGTVRPGAELRWQRKGAADPAFVNLPDAVATTLRVNAVTMAMNGDEFRCVVTDATGTTISSIATLVVGPPTVGMLGGNRQITEPGRFNTLPFDLAVWDAAGTQPLVDTPVTFTVESGGGQLATTSSGTPLLASSLTLKTDADGTVKAYYQHASVSGISSEIKAAAGTHEVIFESTSLAAAAANADGLDSQGEISGESRSATTGKGGILASAAGGGGRFVIETWSDKKGSDSEMAMSAQMEDIAGLQLVLRTRANEYYSVNTSTWAIASAPAP